MKGYMEERVLKVARYITENKCTVREAAKELRMSKSTVHKDLTERLPKLNKHAAFTGRTILNHNRDMRHIRGGMATHKLYKGGN